MNEEKGRIYGYTKYKEKEKRFEYLNGILQIFLDGDIPTKNTDFYSFIQYFESIKEEIKENKWIEPDTVNGITSEGKNISFSGNELPADDGVIKYEIFNVYIYEEEEIDEVWVKGIAIRKFFELYSMYEKIKGFDNVIEREIGKYNYNGIDIHIIMKVDVGNIRSSKNQLGFRFSSSKTKDFAMDIVHHGRNFLQYICNRRNIKFDEIVVYKNVQGIKKQNGFLILREDIDVHDDTNFREIIPYNLLKERTAILFQEIARKNIYLENLPRNNDEKSIYEINRIILDFAAFEKYFQYYYGEYKIQRSEQYKTLKNKILEYFDRLESQSARKEKRYIKDFKERIEYDKTSLGDKIKYVLKENRNDLQFFLKRFYDMSNEDDVYKEISKRMNKLRNAIAHGDLGVEIQPIHVNDIIILEVLLYIMVLRGIGIEKNIEISRNIKQILKK